MPLAPTSAKQPDPVLLKIREIAGLMAQNRMAQAEAGARALLKAHPTRAEAHNILGMVCAQQRKRTEALKHMEFAVKSDPRNPIFLSSLGRLYLDLDLIELALPPLHNALTINPRMSIVLWSLGEYYYSIGKAKLALPYLERAIRIEPGNAAYKWALAESLDALGRTEDASRIYEELRSDKAWENDGIVRLARNGRHDPDSPLLAEIETKLKSPALDPKGLNALHTAAGHIYERNRDYRRAFEHFDKANAAMPVPFAIERYRDWIDRAIAIFKPETFAQRRTMGSASNLPVFVVGMPRSGTTLAEQIIASHPRAGGAGELMRMKRFADRLHYRRDIGKFLPSFDALGGARTKALAESYVSLLKFFAPEAERVVDKLPHNFELLGLIALLLPNARIVHCRRNPLDTCWSCYQNQLKDGHAYSRDLTHLGLYYREYARLMDHWRKVLPIQIYDLDYERLTADFETEARRLIEFIGLPWDPACLKFHEADTTVHTISRQQVRSPVYTSSVGRWRNYQDELKPLIAAIGDLS